MAPTRRAVLGMTATMTLGLAGCTGGQAGDGGGGGDGPSGSSPAPDGGTTTGGTTTTGTTTGGGMTGTSIAVSDHSELGEILVDGEGMTLYMFDPDEQGAGASACSGGCADAWPPLAADGSPSTGEGVSAELTTFQRDDGSTQVAANGWPLYYWQGDSSPGDATGQGVNDVWWVLDPAGEPVRGTTTTSAATGGSGDGGDGGGPY